MPFNLRFAELTTAVGVQGGHQELTAPSPDNIGLWDPNSNHRIAGYTFNEFKFSETTKAQISGRIERVDLSGTARIFDDTGGLIDSMRAAPNFTPKSAAAGLIQNLPWDLVASITAQHVERAPKPAELFSGGAHDATATFDKGNPNLAIEKADSIEAGLRRAIGPLRFELTAYYTKFNGFIFRDLTGNTCDPDTNKCGPGVGDPNVREAIYSQRDATFRGGEFQSQYDVMPLWTGMFGVEGQADIVRATFADGSNVPRIPPVRAGGGLFWRDDNWLVRSNLLHAFSHTDINSSNETPTAGYNLLKAEISYRWSAKPGVKTDIREWVVGITGDNLLNSNIRNSVSYNKDEVLMPGRSAKVFASVKF
jgi:iron complex outermembrane receptor protein